MNPDWKEYSVEDFADVYGGGTPSTINSDYFGGEIPWLTPKDLSNYQFRYISNGERNLTPLGLENSSSCLLPAGTILLTSRAPVGYLAIARNPVSTNQGFKSLIPKEDFDNLFIYYLLKANIDYLKSQASGSTFAELSGSTLKKLKFILPPLPEQRAIADVLSTLDDKIELNCRMNQTLESLAQTLFKHMFIDNPDRAGWEERTIKDFAIVTSGLRPEKREKEKNQEFQIPIFGGGGVMAYTNRPLYSSPILLTGRVGTLGKIFRISNPIWASDNTLVFMFNNPFVFEYVYFSLLEFDFVAINRGSTQPLVTQSDIQKIRLCEPPINLLQEFHHTVSKLFALQDSNIQEIETLAELRDTLLPKLMSGQIRVCPS